MREIIELLRLAERHYGRTLFLRLWSTGGWAITTATDQPVVEGRGSDADPTADIIAALKAKLPPTLQEAKSAFSCIACGEINEARIATVRRYLEAQKE